MSHIETLITDGQQSAESTLLLVELNGKEWKTNANNVKPDTILKLIENTFNAFLNSLKTGQMNCDYNMRPCS